MILHEFVMRSQIIMFQSFISEFNSRNKIDINFHFVFIFCMWQVQLLQ